MFSIKEMTDGIAEVKGDNPNVTHVMTENEFCMIWVIFLCQQTNVMAFLCFISDNQFVKTELGPNTRSKKHKYKTPICRLTRTRKGPIPYLTSLLNSEK